jgi:NADPH-dependent curcumin reductase CurA
LLNTHARVPLCGLIAQYQGEGGQAKDFAPQLLRAILTKRLTVRGFIIFDDYGARFGEFRDQMSTWLQAGKIKYREDVVEGLEKAPEAFLGLLTGQNFGKLVVKVSA